ncbi:MAG TPA: ATP-binding protein [Phycisphaerae bacterium]|nr:ATP-binding protein [Phycisphaerae bacterium]HRY68627.1 ATP-binding protein [Phycisphaerae bacterium]HSA25453.1 ATP-binding protein [Phycisphaerae bacterium]
MDWRQRYELAALAARQIVYDGEVATKKLVWGGSIEQILGYTPSEMNGGFEQWVERIDPKDRVEALRAFEVALRDGTPYECEYGFRHKDGHYIDMLDRGLLAVGRGGRPDRFVGVMQDITERKHLQEERARLEDLLRQTHKLEALGQLAGGVAHDFGNLVTVILGNVALLRGSLEGRATAKESLDMIEQAAQDAMALARSMLTFSRRLPVQKKLIDLAVDFPKWCHLCRRLVPSSVRVTEHFGVSAGLVVHADATQLQQVLMNLVMNAKDAMPDGGRLDVVLRAAQAEDLARFSDLEAKRTYAVVEIRDSGCGISAAIGGRIFEPFFTTKERGKGTGLGLAVVQSIVRDHGGRIEFSSTEGRGSTFTLVFPCLDADAPSVSGDRASPHRGRGELLLVAERDPHVRSILVSTLVAAGYRVVEAGDGLELLTKFQELGTGVRLLVVDMDLEKRSGLECLRAIRNGGRQTPAILIASGPASGVEAPLPARSAVLTKPYRIEDLRGLVADLLVASDEMPEAS